VNRDNRGLLTPVRRVGALVALLVLLTACKADVRVDVTVADDGSGAIAVRVDLDADAVQKLTAFAPIDQAVPLDDLRAAGWDVSSWQTASDGGASIELHHTFVGEDDLERRLGDLAPPGVIADARIDRSRGWFRTRDEVSLAVDLRKLAAGVASDPELAGNLRAAGLDVDALETQFTEQLGDALTVEVAVHAPDGTTRTAKVTPGSHEEVAVSAASFDRGRVLVLSVAAGLAVVAVCLLVVARRSARRARRRGVRRASPDPTTS
jgi:hypothetical protein